MSYKPEQGRNNLFALGHSCIEYFANVNYEFLKKLNLRKGDSNNSDKIELVKKLLNPKEIIIDCGSVESNTACGYSLLGLPASFTGSVGDDYNGRFFRRDIINYGVTPYFSIVEGDTSIIYTLITPDKERTFVCQYGEHQGVKAESLQLSNLASSAFFHSCAYAIDRHLGALEKSVEHSKENNVRVSFDVASVGFINKYKTKIDEILSKTDILFLNEDEAAALGFKDPFKLMESMHKKYNLSLIAFKMGEKGSILSTGKKNETIYIPAYKVEEVNTSGAGDSYAAGLLHSIAKGHDLLTSGRIASYYASRTVMKLSSRPEMVENIEKFI